MVSPNTPAPHSTPVVQIKDTLTVTGLSANATGNVVVGLYTSSDCTTGQQGTDATFPVSAAVNRSAAAASRASRRSSRRGLRHRSRVEREPR